MLRNASMSEAMQRDRFRYPITKRERGMRRFALW